jgi:hypothetical protein
MGGAAGHRVSGQPLWRLYTALRPCPQRLRRAVALQEMVKTAHARHCRGARRRCTTAARRPGPVEFDGGRKTTDGGIYFYND